jgi:hypothetical protein
LPYTLQALAIIEVLFFTYQLQALAKYEIFLPCLLQAFVFIQ